MRASSASWCGRAKTSWAGSTWPSAPRTPAGPPWGPHRGGGFALMTEALGAAAMMEIPVVCINVQRAGPATGVPTKTEQGDLWQVLGAGQGDYPKLVVAPSSQLDLFQTIPELFNLCDKYQCPGLVLADLLISEGTSSIDPDDLDFNVTIERGELILPPP